MRKLHAFFPPCPLPPSVGICCCMCTPSFAHVCLSVHVKQHVHLSIRQPAALLSTHQPCCAAPQAYTAQRESPAIIAQELASVSSAAFAADINAPEPGGGADEDADDSEALSTEFRVRTSTTLREAVAVLAVEEGSALELGLQLPPAWPLRPALIEPRRKVRRRARQWSRAVRWGACSIVFGERDACNLAAALAETAAL